MKKICLLILISTPNLILSQIQQYFFKNDVDTVERLTVEICIGDQGQTNSVEIVNNKTTYDNQDFINQIIEYRKGYDFYPETKFKNKCFESVFYLVNPKYESLETKGVDCKSSLKKEYLDM